MLADFINYTALFIRNHISEICFGITAVTMMLFGPKINGTIRKLIKKLHWLLRYAIFILVCTVGYTFISHVIFQGTKNLLLMFFKQRPLFVMITIGIYLVLAWIAKEQKAI
ncbi:MAG: DUF3392 domain-containing protein [Chitinispirillaceae bacterium]|nr:DUF3392 domain-containing protein [Chitinispirillaceae bacterium]